MPRRILIVDDALIIRKMIHDLVTDNDWEVVAQATNGQQAAELYEQHSPDAVTLDMVMPEFDGLHALRQIKKQDPDANVLVVSAIDQQDTLSQAISLGADDFIIKPFDPVRLITALDKLVPAISQSSANK